MMTVRSFARFSMVAALVVAVAGCEPADTGGGGGAGDEGHFAFIKGENRLASAAADGTDLAFHTSAGTFAKDPALSPNGQTIAFAYSPTNNKDNTAIYVVPRTSPVDTGLQALTDASSSESFTSPSWDSGSANLYFVGSSGKIFRLPSAGGVPPEQVAASVTNAKFVAVIDASTLLVTDTSSAISKVDIATGTATSLGVSTTSRPAVSPNHQKFAYSDSSGVIVVRDLATNTGNDLPPPSGQAKDVNPTFSPDSTFVAFESGGAIVATTADGTGSRQTFFSEGTSPSWAL